MKITKVDCDFLRICDECGDFVTVGYEIELSKYLLQETYLND